MPNNFIENPGGSGSRGTGVDFTRSPGGKTAVPQQSTGEAYDLNANEMPAGGRILLADATPGPTKDLGVGTIGNGQKPFKLGA